MSDKRHIEIFTAGCPACDDTVEMVKQMVCPCCDVSILKYARKGSRQPCAGAGHTFGARCGRRWETGRLL